MRTGKKLISRATPDGSFTAARVSTVLKNLLLIYDRLSSPYSLRAQNYVLNVLQQHTLMPQRSELIGPEVVIKIQVESRHFYIHTHGELENNGIRFAASKTQLSQEIVFYARTKSIIRTRLLISRV